MNETERLGMLVRQVWITWAKEQPDIDQHPNWLTGWCDLAERDREVDRMIGDAVASYVALQLGAWRAQAEPLLRTLLDVGIFKERGGWGYCFACGVEGDSTVPHAADCPVTQARALLAEGGQE